LYWGWAGFVTRDLKRCRIIARLIALIYNWWNIFTRLARPDQHMEAITSRPLLLHAVGRMVTTGRRKILRLTSTHAMSDQIRRALNRIGHFLNRLARTAEQLSVEAVWAIILSVAFVKWLRGRVLHPVVEGDQMLLQLLFLGLFQFAQFTAGQYPAQLELGPGRFLFKTGAGEQEAGTQDAAQANLVGA
jgi:hypothetical protein